MPGLPRHCCSAGQAYLHKWQPHEHTFWWLRLTSEVPFVRLQDKIATVEQLLAHISSGKQSHLDLQSRAIHAETGLQSNTSSMFTVWRTTAHGCVVRSASLVIPKGGTLLLDGCGAHFRHVTFTGVPVPRNELDTKNETQCLRALVQCCGEGCVLDSWWFRPAQTHLLYHCTIPKLHIPFTK